MRAEVVGQVLDLFGQDGDLDLWGARIGGMNLKFFNNALLFGDV